MQKTILITGSTDGIGLETAKRLAAQGHRVLLHGRSSDKLAAAAAAVGGDVEQFLADLSDLAAVESLAKLVSDALVSSGSRDTLDVLINNAGVFKGSSPTTAAGLDLRFVVNTLAPYVLTRRLLPRMNGGGRIINLSSAAQAPVSLAALAGKGSLSDMDAYAQSKLAITMWSKLLADELPDGPVVLAVNPGSLLASKMVREGFGVAGNDLGIGADLLCRAATSEDFASASGKYYDNDIGGFGPPHADALDLAKARQVVAVIEAAISRSE